MSYIGGNYFSIIRNQTNSSIYISFRTASLREYLYHQAEDVSKFIWDKYPGTDRTQLRPRVYLARVCSCDVLLG